MRKIFLMISLLISLQQLGIAQNVGIGTTTPAAQLHIKYAVANTSNGVPVLILDNPTGGTQTTLQFQIDGVETGRIRSSSNGTFTYTTIGNGDHIFKSDNDNNEIMILQAITGNVGIGTTTPGTKLHIQEPGPTVLNLQSTFNTAHFRSVSPAGVEAGINFSTMSGLARPRWIIGKGDGAETGSEAGSNLIINRYDDGGNYLGRPLEIVRSTGEVLINNKLTTPSFKLLSGATSGYILQSDASGNASWASPSSAVAPGTGLYYIGNTLHSMWATSGADIYSGNTGNVGVGAVTPLAKLAVYSPNDRLLKLESMSTTGTWLDMQNTSAGGATFSIISTGSANGEGAGKLLINAPSNQLAIDNTGKLGIGTTSPGSTLHVKYGSANTSVSIPALILDNPSSGTQTSLQFRIDGTETGRIRSDLSGNVVYSSIGSGSHYFRKNDTDDWMVIDGNTGNVGIGTTSPSEKLEVAGKIKVTDFAMTNGATNGYVLQSDASGNGTWVASSSAITAGTGLSWSGNTLNSVWSENSGDIYRTTGNVGIGASSPSAKLHVSSSSNIVGHMESSSTIGTWFSVYNGSAGGTTWEMISTGSGNSEGAGNLLFRGNADVKMIVQSSTGNVGIGTSSPSARLHVTTAGSNNNIISESTTASAYLGLRSATNSESAIRFNTSSVNRWLIGKSTGTESGSDAGADFFINRYSDAGGFLGQPLLIKRSNGNVGIGGIGNPAQKLDVSGNINVSSTNGYYINNSRVVSIDGTNNLLVGVSAGQSITTGSNNTAIGHNALDDLADGINNVAIGDGAGASITDGNGGVFIGHNAGQNETQGAKLYIENSSSNAPLIYGDFGTDSVAINGSLIVEGNFGMKVRTGLTAGGTQPNKTAAIWIYTTGTGAIDLTIPAGTDRILVIINQTGAARIISSYRDLSNAVQTTINNNTSLWLVYDGSNWRQIK